ncbi:MAG TPA: hypothetical protein VFV90_00055 [Usitatibacter sp.]|nr:hypothetical protein [Usitatibacter sp.]
MPTFRTTPSSNLTTSIRRMLASQNVGPMMDVQADIAAARTARDMSLAEKARLEVEDMQRAEALRRDPAAATEYASRAAGLTDPQGTALSRYIRGEMQPAPQPLQEEAAGLGVGGLPDQPAALPSDVTPAQRGAFSNALAALIANQLATGKTNVQQLTAGQGNLQEQDLQRQAAEAPDVATGNRLIAAMAGKLRTPFRLGTQGQVLNEETGGLNETTNLAQAAAALSGARTTTEGSKQTELGTRSTRNTALANLAAERAAAVKRGETGKGGQRVSPQQVERWASEVARKEWDAIPARERVGMTYAQHLQKVRERFMPKGDGSGGIAQDTQDALDAINRGAPAKEVRARFRKRWGKDLIEVAPDPTDSGLGAGADALDEE